MCYGHPYTHYQPDSQSYSSPCICRKVGEQHTRSNGQFHRALDFSVFEDRIRMAIWPEHRNHAEARAEAASAQASVHPARWAADPELLIEHLVRETDSHPAGKEGLSFSAYRDLLASRLPQMAVRHPTRARAHRVA